MLHAQCSVLDQYLFHYYIMLLNHAFFVKHKQFNMTCFQTTCVTLASQYNETQCIFINIKSCNHMIEIYRSSFHLRFLCITTRLEKLLTDKNINHENNVIYAMHETCNDPHFTKRRKWKFRIFMYRYDINTDVIRVWIGSGI
jgi:hypothetical protein